MSFEDKIKEFTEDSILTIEYKKEIFKHPSNYTIITNKDQLLNLLNKYFEEDRQYFFLKGLYSQSRVITKKDYITELPLSLDNDVWKGRPQQLDYYVLNKKVNGDIFEDKELNKCIVSACLLAFKTKCSIQFIYEYFNKQTQNKNFINNIFDINSKNIKIYPLKQ